MSTATLFMATLRQPYAAPKADSSSPSASADPASSGSGRVSESTAQDSTVTRGLPNRRHSAPATSMVATAPAERPSSARPRAADDAPVCSLTAGTRTAQLANMNPCAANTAHSAIRSRPRSPGPPGRRRDVTSACWILLTGDTKSGYVTLGLALRRGQVLLRPRQVRPLGRVTGPLDRGAVGRVRLGPAA